MNTNTKLTNIKTIFHNSDRIYTYINDGMSKSGNECVLNIFNSMYEITFVKQKSNRKIEVLIQNVGYIKRESIKTTLILDGYDIRLCTNSSRKGIKHFNPRDIKENLSDLIDLRGNSFFMPSFHNNPYLTLRIKRILINRTKKFFPLYKNKEVLKRSTQYWNTFHKLEKFRNNLNTIYNDNNGWTKKLLQKKNIISKNDVLLDNNSFVSVKHGIQNIIIQKGYLTFEKPFTFNIINEDNNETLTLSHTNVKYIKVKDLSKKDLMLFGIAGKNLFADDCFNEGKLNIYKDISLNDIITVIEFRIKE